MSGSDVPDNVATAIDQLKSGRADSISDAHSSLQLSVLGHEGCLRMDTPRVVAWADTVWADFVSLLPHKNNHVRSIAGQLLCNLSQSTKQSTVLRGFARIEATTHDEKFVTARHVLQSMWKVGLSGGGRRTRYAKAAEDRYRSCHTEKNATLIRYDIVVGLRTLFDISEVDSLRKIALELIALETDEKYRKKYTGVWRDSC